MPPSWLSRASAQGSTVPSRCPRSCGVMAWRASSSSSEANRAPQGKKARAVSSSRAKGPSARPSLRTTPCSSPMRSSFPARLGGSSQRFWRRPRRNSSRACMRGSSTGRGRSARAARAARRCRAGRLWGKTMRVRDRSRLPASATSRSARASMKSALQGTMRTGFMAAPLPSIQQAPSRGGPGTRAARAGPCPGPGAAGAPK